MDQISLHETDEQSVSSTEIRKNPSKLKIITNLIPEDISRRGSSKSNKSSSVIYENQGTINSSRKSENYNFKTRSRSIADKSQSNLAVTPPINRSGNSSERKSNKSTITSGNFNKKSDIIISGNILKKSNSKVIRSNANSNISPQLDLDPVVLWKSETRNKSPNHISPTDYLDQNSISPNDEFQAYNPLEFPNLDQYQCGPIVNKQIGRLMNDKGKKPSKKYFQTMAKKIKSTNRVTKTLKDYGASRTKLSKEMQNSESKRTSIIGANAADNRMQSYDIEYEEPISTLTIKTNLLEDVAINKQSSKIFTSRGSGTAKFNFTNDDITQPPQKLSKSRSGSKASPLKEAKNNFLQSSSAQEDSNLKVNSNLLNVILALLPSQDSPKPKNGIGIELTKRESRRPHALSFAIDFDDDLGIGDLTNVDINDSDSEAEVDKEQDNSNVEATKEVDETQEETEEESVENNGTFIS